MRRMLRWATSTVLVLVGIVVVLGVAVALVNLRDETLDPRAAELLKPVPYRVAGADNGFPDLLGLKAPAGADARAWGRQWIADAGAVTDNDSAAAFRAKYDDTKAAKLDVFCNPVATACLAKVAQDRAAAGAVLDKNRAQLGRYQRLFAYAGMEESYEPQSPAAPIMAFQTLFASQSLHLAEVALRAGDKDVRGALDLLERDLALQRRMLGGARLLITKIIAAETYARDLALLSELLRVRRDDMALYADRLTRMTAPLTAAERSMVEVLRSEFRVHGNFLLHLLRDVKPADLGFADLPAFVVPWLYQPNATVNLHYRIFEPVLALDTAVMPPKPVAKTPAPDVFTWTLPYNYFGKLLISVGAPDFSAYPERVADLDGLSRLVALQAGIAARRVANDRIGAYLADQDAGLANPYTGAPMHWDAQAAQLGFEPRSQKWRNQRFGGKLSWLAISL